MSATDREREFYEAGVRMGAVAASPLGTGAWLHVCQAVDLMHGP